eukprot:g19726.t1
MGKKESMKKAKGGAAKAVQDAKAEADKKVVRNSLMMDRSLVVMGGGENKPPPAESELSFVQKCLQEASGKKKDPRVEDPEANAKQRVTMQLPKWEREMVGATTLATITKVVEQEIHNTKQAGNRCFPTHFYNSLRLDYVHPDLKADVLAPLGPQREFVLALEESSKGDVLSAKVFKKKDPITIEEGKLLMVWLRCALGLGGEGVSAAHAPHFAEELATSVLFAITDDKRTAVLHLFLEGGVLRERLARWYDVNVLSKRATEHLKTGTAKNYLKLAVPRIKIKWVLKGLGIDFDKFEEYLDASADELNADEVLRWVEKSADKLATDLNSFISKHPKGVTDTDVRLLVIDMTKTANSNPERDLLITNDFMVDETARAEFTAADVATKVKLLVHGGIKHMYKDHLLPLFWEDKVGRIFEVVEDLKFRDQAPPALAYGGASLEEGEDGGFPEDPDIGLSLPKQEDAAVGAGDGKKDDVATTIVSAPAGGVGISTGMGGSLVSTSATAAPAASSSSSNYISAFTVPEMTIGTENESRETLLQTVPGGTSQWVALFPHLLGQVNIKKLDGCFFELYLCNARIEQAMVAVNMFTLHSLVNAEGGPDLKKRLEELASMCDLRFIDYQTTYDSLCRSILMIAGVQTPPQFDKVDPAILTRHQIPPDTAEASRQFILALVSRLLTHRDFIRGMDGVRDCVLRVDKEAKTAKGPNFQEEVRRLGLIAPLMTKAGRAVFRETSELLKKQMMGGGGGPKRVMPSVDSCLVQVATKKAKPSPFLLFMASNSSKSTSSSSSSSAAAPK